MPKPPPCDSQSDDLRTRTKVLTLWSMGAVVLHEHARRLLDVDLTGDPEAMRSYAVPATEILGRPLLGEGVYEQIRAVYPDPAGADEDGDHAG